VRAVRDNRRADLLALAILALLPTLLFSDLLLGINSFYAGDITNYHLPGKKILREIVLGGEFPYWNPILSAGQPLAANPAHEVFYPLTWLILLPRYDLAFHFLILAHFFIALFGMYALLRSMDLSPPAAVIGAISFGLGGVMLSTINVLPFLFSMSWMPLTCLFARRYLLGHAPRDGVLASIFLGIQLLIGEPATVIQSGIVLGIYAVYRGIHDGRNAGAVARRVAAVGAISIGALFVAAVQVLPTLDHFRDSVRSRGLDFAVAGYWSMPLTRVVELVYPNAFGHGRLDGPLLYWASRLYPTELRPFVFGIYPGLLIAVLVVGGVLARVRGAGVFTAIALTSWILAAGRNTPLFRWMYDSGIASWFRFPEKFAFMGVFAAVVFGACILDRLLQGDAKVQKVTIWFTAAVTAIAFGAWLVALTPAYESLFRRIWLPRAMSPIETMLALSRTDWLLAGLRGLLLLILLRSLDRRRIWLTLIGVFVVIDLSSMIPDLAPRVTSSFHRDPPAVVRQFPKERDAYRVFNHAAWNRQTGLGRYYSRPDPYLYWTSRNALMGFMPASYGLRTAIESDYDQTHLLPTKDFTLSVFDLSLKRPNDYVDIAASMSNVWYAGFYRQPSEAIALAQGDPRAIQPVQFIERVHHPRYYFARRVVTIRDRADFVRRLNETPDPTGLACIDDEAFEPAGGVVRRWHESANGARIEVEAAGRTFLVMSVTPHKYWRITIDGREASAQVTNVGYQGVVVPPGPHVVEMQYRNPLIPAGGAVSVATLLAFALIARRKKIGP